MLRLVTAVEEAGALKLTGVAMNDIVGLAPDQEIAVTFRGDEGVRAIKNFTKGNGGTRSLAQPDSAAGAFLTLESCYLTEDKQGELPVVSSRWLNTLSSPNVDEHANRSYMEYVYAMAPRVQFANPDYRDGVEEPKTITIPISQEKFSAKVPTEHGVFNREFDRAWGVEKLGRLPKDSKPSVFIDAVEPRDAKAVHSEAELTQVLTEQLSRGTRALALLRVTDGEEVVSRLVYGSYKKEGEDYLPDVEKALEDLFKNNVFKDIPNEALFEGLKDGTLRVDALPGYRLNYAGNPTLDDNAAYKLVQDLKNNKTIKYEMVFGTEPNKFASVLLPGIARSEDITGFSPINVIADRPGKLGGHEIVTAVIDPGSLKAAPEEPAGAPSP
ncbi:MAG: hypothetical protein ACREVJ_05755 [Gammaproteobacteria bacterium]